MKRTRFSRTANCRFWFVTDVLTSMQMADLEVGGLNRGLASNGVRSALECIRGVARVTVLPDMHHVSVTYDAFRVSPDQFETAVRVMGCGVESMVLMPLPLKNEVMGPVEPAFPIAEPRSDFSNPRP